MINDDCISIAPHPVGMNHNPSIRGPDRIAIIGADIDPGMKALCAENRVNPPAKGRSDFAFRRPNHGSGTAADVFLTGLNPLDHLFNLPRGFNQLAISSFGSFPFIGGSVQNASPFFTSRSDLFPFDSGQFAKIHDFFPVGFQLFLGLAQSLPVGLCSLNQCVIMRQHFFQKIHPADKIVKIFGPEQNIQITDLPVFVNVTDPSVQDLGLRFEFLGQPSRQFQIRSDFLLRILQLVVDRFKSVLGFLQFLLDQPQLFRNRLLFASRLFDPPLLRFHLLLDRVQLLLLFLQFIRQHRRRQQQRKA